MISDLSGKIDFKTKIQVKIKGKTISPKAMKK